MGYEYIVKISFLQNIVLGHRVFLMNFMKDVTRSSFYVFTDISRMEVMLVYE